MNQTLARVGVAVVCVAILGQYGSIAQAMINLKGTVFDSAGLKFKIKDFYNDPLSTITGCQNALDTWYEHAIGSWPDGVVPPDYKYRCETSDGWLEDLGDVLEDAWEDIEQPAVCTGLAVATTAMCGIEVAACLYSIFADQNVDYVCVTDEFGNTRCANDVKVPGWACLAEAGLVISGNDPCVKLAEKFLDECAK